MLQVGILWFQQILKDGTLILLKQKIVQKLFFNEKSRCLFANGDWTYKRAHCTCRMPVLGVGHLYEHVFGRVGW